MTWQPKRRTWPWRKFLTADERKLVEVLDREKQSLDQRRRAISAVLNPIHNRAAQRARARAAEAESRMADA